MGHQLKPLSVPTAESPVEMKHREPFGGISGETVITAVASFDKIPDELKERNQWVVWKGKKVPYNPCNRQPASTRDSSTWSGFSETMAVYTNGGFNGIGFVFTADDPYAGVDLDHCRNPETGEFEPWAKTIVASLDSYAEISQSGTGLHIFVKGKLPGTRRKKSVPGGGAIEMYDSGRYFTMTGNRLKGTPENINDRNDELGKLYAKWFGDAKPSHKKGKAGSIHEQDVVLRGPVFKPATPTASVIEDDDELVNRARAAVNGKKFEALFDHGDISAYDNDDSCGRPCSLLLASFSGWK